MNNFKLNRWLSLSLCSSFLALSAHSFAADKEITLEKIMSDPIWIGQTPQAAKWLPDSKTIVFEQKQEGSVITKQFAIDYKGDGKAKVIDLADYYKTKASQLTLSQDRKLAAYVYEGDIFLWHIKSGKVEQITATVKRESSPVFLHNNQLGFRAGQQFTAFNLSNRKFTELLDIKFGKAPSSPKAPEDIIASEQHKLIKYVALQQKNRVERFEQKQKIESSSTVTKAHSFYFDKELDIEEISVSPSGKKAIIVLEPDLPSRSDSDVMPNYIAQDGRIEIEKVRRRVADAKPVQQQFWILDLTKGTQQQLLVSDLPDFDKDVLKDVKEENAKALGQTYTSETKPRFINLIEDWYWDQSAIQWHKNGKQLAIMFEAWDNKDRWLTTVDFASNKLITQHQLHDDAWVNYTFNEFGWFNNDEKLYYLSEETGYSHLYTKSLNDKSSRQITKGEFEVSNPYLLSNDDAFIFKANVNHPGDYHIYKVNSSAKAVSKPTAITTRVGQNDFEISFDERTLLIEHSSLLRPTELFTLDLNGRNEVQLTDTVSAEFKSMPWQAPEILKVPSSHVDKPIYAKVYYPKNYQAGQPNKAVIFNHGAGYLQNSHKGWSGYFREFMFHNLLAQQGYVVMDMDYRASKGYGRDWRTAIYRHMGKPEIEDLADGVNWMVKNANVDKNRVGTYGGSYGGFMTFMALMTQPELFKAGAALRPVSDWAHYNDGYTSNILNRPADDMIAYRRSSPIYFAEGLKNPLLINAPMVDNNVFFVDVVRLVQRFIELEKENFETAIYPVEPHGFKQPSSWLDEYRRIYKLFEQNL